MPTDNPWNNVQGSGDVPASNAAGDSRQQQVYGVSSAQRGSEDVQARQSHAQSQQAGVTAEANVQQLAAQVAQQPADQVPQQAGQQPQQQAVQAAQQAGQQPAAQAAAQTAQQFPQQQASAAQAAQQQWQVRQQQPAQQQTAPGAQQPSAQQQAASVAQQQAMPGAQQQAASGAQQRHRQQPAGGAQQHWQAGQQYQTNQQQTMPPSQGAYATSVPYQPAPPQKKGHGWIVAIVIIVCLFAFSAFAVKSCTDAMATLPTTSSSSGLEDLSGDTIGIINLDGTIQYDGSLCSPEGLKEMLDKAQESSHIKAIVLRVNSGGGVATAGEEMAEYLRQFEKPVVVSSASINASAAYEISAQADYIYTAKSTEIGSIGTAMELTDLSGLFEKLGISMDTITSADSKDSTYGHRPLTDDERAYYQKMVDQINDTFIENVVVGRKMDEKDVRKLATGLVFTGLDAVDNGLADAIGTREDAIKKAAELAGVTDYDTTNLVLPSYDISSLAYLFGDASSSTDELAAALRELQESQSRTK